MSCVDQQVGFSKFPGNVEIKWKRTKLVMAFPVCYRLLCYRDAWKITIGYGLFSIILSQISPEIISITRDPSQLSRIMTKRSQIQNFVQKWLQSKFIFFAGLKYDCEIRNTKIEYFWVISWPSSAYWIIKSNRCMLKVPPNFQDYPWLLFGV